MKAAIVRRYVLIGGGVMWLGLPGRSVCGMGVLALVALSPFTGGRSLMILPRWPTLAHAKEKSIERPCRQKLNELAVS